MANVKKIIAAHLSQRQRQINKQVERAEILGEDRLLCNIIRVDGNIGVPNRPGFVWCQEYSPSNDTSPFHAFNVKVQPREGLVVWVGEGLGGRREVLDWHNGTIVATPDYDDQKYQPKHSSDHAWPDFKPGPDVLSVYPRALTMLRSYPGEAGGLTISVSTLRYIKDGAIITFPGTNSLDISASQPASGLARFVGVYLDWDDNSIKTVNGSTTSDSPAITPDSPTFPDSAILSANVRLDGDQTSISEIDIVDARQLLSFTGPGAVQVSEVWESDFGAVALQSDTDGDIGIGTATPGDRLHIVDGNANIIVGEPVNTFGGISFDSTLTISNYSILGQGTDTFINRPTGGTLYFRENNSTQMLIMPTTGYVGINTTGPDARLDILDSSSSQLRLTHTDGSKFVNFTLDTNHDLTIKPSSTGQVKLQPTTDSTDFFQVLDADGGTPILNIDSFNERVGIHTSSPDVALHVESSGDPIKSVTHGFNTNTIWLESTYNGITNVVNSYYLRNDTPAQTLFGQLAVDNITRTAGSETGTFKFAVIDNGAYATRMAISGSNVGIGTTSPSTRLDIDAGAMEFAEMTAPGGGAANTARLYAVDNGAGKTQLAVVFNTGAAQILATEP